MSWFDCACFVLVLLCAELNACAMFCCTVLFVCACAFAAMLCSVVMQFCALPLAVMSCLCSVESLCLRVLLYTMFVLAGVSFLLSCCDCCCCVSLVLALFSCPPDLRVERGKKESSLSRDGK